MNWKLEMRDKNKQISRQLLIMTLFSLSCALIVPFLAQTAGTTQIVNWAQSLDVDTTSDTSALPKTWKLHLLIYFVRGSEEPMIRNNVQKDFCVVSNFFYQFIFLCKVSESNKSWEYGGVKLFYFWRNPFFIKLSPIKLLEYFCWRVSLDASSQVWMFG